MWHLTRSSKAFRESSGLRWSGSERTASRQTDPVRPTSVRPDSVRPTSVRPDSVRPTSVRPTSVRPTSVRPDLVRPTRATERRCRQDQPVDTPDGAGCAPFRATFNPDEAGRNGSLRATLSSYGLPVRPTGRALIWETAILTTMLSDARWCLLRRPGLLPSAPESRVSRPSRPHLALRARSPNPNRGLPPEL